MNIKRSIAKLNREHKRINELLNAPAETLSHVGPNQVRAQLKKRAKMIENKLKDIEGNK